MVFDKFQTFKLGLRLGDGLSAARRLNHHRCPPRLVKLHDRLGSLLVYHVNDAERNVIRIQAAAAAAACPTLDEGSVDPAPATDSDPTPNEAQEGGGIIAKADLAESLT